jgi:apolipoprotein N-acyltransferase
MAKKVMIPKKDHDYYELPMTYKVQKTKEESGAGIISFIIGVLGLFLGLLSPIVGIFLGIFGMITGKYARNTNQTYGIAGLIMGFIAFIIWATWILIVLIANSVMTWVLPVIVLMYVMMAVILFSPRRKYEYNEMEEY